MHMHDRITSTPRAPCSPPRRYCFYHETQNILGNTYGMAVLQVGCITAVGSWHSAETAP